MPSKNSTGSRSLNCIFYFSLSWIEKVSPEQNYHLLKINEKLEGENKVRIVCERWGVSICGLPWFHCVFANPRPFFSGYKNSFSDLGHLAKVKGKLLTWLRITIIEGDGKTASACDLNKQNICKGMIFFYYTIIFFISAICLELKFLTGHWM